MNIYEKIEVAISEQVKHGNEKFVIYPFGKNGIVAKQLLNWRYGIKEKAIVDNNLASINPNICTISKMKNFDDCIWLITCSNANVHEEIIAWYIPQEQIIDIFENEEEGVADCKLLSQIGKGINNIPCWEFVEIVEKKKNERRKINIAEIGIDIGATAVEVCKRLEEKDTYYCFDFEEKVEGIIEDLKKIPDIKCNLIGKGNSHKIYDSYNWSLCEMLFQIREEERNGIFDVVYLDGAHSFSHDGLACCLLKELLKPKGYIIFDDMKWSFQYHQAAYPTFSSALKEKYTDNQIRDCQIQRVVNAFMINDNNFEEVYMSNSYNSDRAIFRKK